MNAHEAALKKYPVKISYHTSSLLLPIQQVDCNLHDRTVWIEGYNAGLESKWISVGDQPLYKMIDKNKWEAQVDTGFEFLAAVPYNDSTKPGQSLWWIRHCVIEETGGLHVVTDGDTEPAGWDVTDVTHWMPLPPSPPQTKENDSK